MCRKHLKTKRKKKNENQWKNRRSARMCLRSRPNTTYGLVMGSRCFESRRVRRSCLVLPRLRLWLQWTSCCSYGWTTSEHRNAHTRKNLHWTCLSEGQFVATCIYHNHGLIKKREVLKKLKSLQNVKERNSYRFAIIWNLSTFKRFEATSWHHRRYSTLSKTFRRPFTAHLRSTFIKCINMRSVKLPTEKIRCIRLFLVPSKE